MPGLPSARALLLCAAATLASPSARAQDAEPPPAAEPAPPAQAHPRHPTPHRPPPPKAPQAKAPAPMPAKPAAGKQAAEAPPPTLAEMQPLVHAQANGVAACRNAVGQASLATVDGPHKADSTWVRADPDHHVFRSVVGIDNRAKGSPNGLSVIAATPTPGGGCDTTTVQVYPSARACADIRSDLLREGSLKEELAGMPLIAVANGFQDLLMPAPNGGCVIVAFGIGLSAPAPTAAAQTPAAQAVPPPAPAGDVARAPASPPPPAVGSRPAAPGPGAAR